MWKQIRVNVNTGTIGISEMKPEHTLLGGRSLIAQVMIEEVNPTCDPIGKENKLIMCTGHFAGTNVPTSHRMSVGAKSPLTGGIKESNVGGNAGYYLAGHGIKMLVFEDIPSADNKWYILHIDKNGSVTLKTANNYVGLTNYDLIAHIQNDYGKDVSVISIGPAGERKYLTACVSVTEYQSNYPCRVAGRGGMGCVMGSKGIKAVVIEKPAVRYKPQIADEEGFKAAVKDFTANLAAMCKNQAISSVGTISNIWAAGPTAIMPTRNFSGGAFSEYDKIGPETFMKNLAERGGSNCHPCQPNCPIHCSNIYHGPDGKFLTAALEYETIALNGSNLCINDLDFIAGIDHFCDDFGIDTMELGCTLGVCMEMNVVEFGDKEGALRLVDELKQGTEFGLVMGQGTQKCGEYLDCKRIPTVKGQGMASFDPRNLKGTGLTYAISPMGADHTCGVTMGTGFDGINMGTRKFGQEFISRMLQVMCTVADSSMCLTALLMSMTRLDIVVRLYNSMYGVQFTPETVSEIGVKNILTERAFNQMAGFTVADDRLPEFFYTEPAKATGAVFDFTDEEVQNLYRFV